MNIADLTFDMVRSYAEACRELHDYIADLQQDGFGLVVIPSRGAHPFFDGANRHDYETWPREMPISPFQLIDILYLPFTADFGQASPFESRDIRRYWSRTLAAIVHRNTEDVAYRLHEYLRGSSKGFAIGDTSIKPASSEKFIFVDTVVSGRAICEIFDAFDEYGLTDCHFILLVDERGKRLKAEYRRRIDEMTLSRRATVIQVEKIFTEDEGPAMSGIWTVTFPDIMEHARKMIPELANSNEVGAGLYYFEVANREDSSNLDFTISNAILSTMIGTAVAAGPDHIVKRFLEDFQQHIAATKLQNQAHTKNVADLRIFKGLPIDSTDISGSHVIRAHMAPTRAERFLRNFLAGHKTPRHRPWHD